MASPASHYISPEEYLAAERTADPKSEYFNGEVFAMAGASANRSRICANLTFELELPLRGSACATYTSDLRVLVKATGLYTYPDLTVVCGEPDFDEPGADSLLNPTLVIEVLSPSTEAYDRGGKFAHYRSLPSLREYLLIAQDRPRVEQYVRRERNWDFCSYEGLDAVLPLSCVQSEGIQLAGIYNRVDLPEKPGR